MIWCLENGNFNDQYQNLRKPYDSDNEYFIPKSVVLNLVPTAKKFLFDEFITYWEQHTRKTLCQNL